MSNLLLADENFPLPVINGLRKAGYNVISIASSAPGISDLAVLNLACCTERRLLTFDSDFGDLVFFRGATPPQAILYFRLHLIIIAETLRMALRALQETPDAHLAVVTRENTRLRPFLPKQFL